MAKTGMPQLGVLGDQKSLSLRWTIGCRPSKVIEIAGGVTAEQNRLGTKILYGKTTQVKFDRNGIVAGERTN